jgi:hypothetical protein
MVIIRFPDGTDWFNPNWVFRQVVHDVLETLPDGAEVRFSLENEGDPIV